MSSSQSHHDLLASLGDAERKLAEGLGRKVLALERLQEVSARLATLDLATAVREILKHVLELADASRACLLLREGEEGLRFAYGVELGREEVESSEFRVSRSFVDRALARGEVVVVENLPASAARDQPSVVALGLLALMVIPLRCRAKTLGAIYLDSDRPSHHIRAADPSLFVAFGSQAAVALDNARLHEKLQEECFLLRRSLGESWGFAGIEYRSRAMDRVCRLIRRAAASDIPVLIQGETGTGKELVARAVHRESRRKGRRFLGQNAGALPDTLLESELFGHRRGAFSGALENRQGLFESADGGTVFLDEIGEASPALQVSLLRFLELGSFRRVGDPLDRRADVRIVAATHRDLEAEVAAGRFRADLYYRLSAFPIVVPPLRQRRDDIPVLVEHFISQYNEELEQRVVGLTRTSLQELLEHPWPGNVRELKNLVYRAMVLSPGSERLDLQAAAKRPHACPESVPRSASAPGPERVRTLEEVERDYIREVLERVRGNQSEAARLLGLNRSTLRWRLKKLGLAPPPRKRAALLHLSESI